LSVLSFACNLISCDGVESERRKDEHGYKYVCMLENATESFQYRMIKLRRVMVILEFLVIHKLLRGGGVVSRILQTENSQCQASRIHLL
jgi:hypothetical protein